ncbi:MAG: DNA-binding response regulator [Chloroflexi bacterium HGW-Chloroflexi-10]|nr:MAG: DNA-binding response regulator [Chloroflexi bacterium HGW-Chloroflexi-10]
MTIRIVLADDHNIVREGFRLVLEAQPDFQVVGEASAGIEAIRMVEMLRPDVLVLDLMMPGINGMEVIRQVRALTKVVILSMHNNEAYVLESLRNGAHGYVLKDATTKELIQAVIAASQGQRYLSAPFAERAIEVYSRLTDNLETDPLNLITNREREVMILVAQGNSSPQIGEMLGISPRTVEVHRANLMRKLNFRSQTDLIRFAIKHGLLTITE